MAVYIDAAMIPYGRMLMSHMVADGIQELHDAAVAVGMRATWYQPLSFPHFDVNASRRREAIARGAIVVDRRGIVEIKRRLRSCPAFLSEVRRHHEMHGHPMPRFMPIAEGGGER